MAIYVDNLVNVVKNKNWHWNKACHLCADTEKELHEFALSIGLKRSRFQKNSSIDRYDLNASKRVQAVKNGARQLSNKQMIKKMTESRNRKG